MKIIHISDLHLKKLYRGSLPVEITNILMEDTWKAIREVAKYSNEIKAEIFMISGDLFEREFFNLKDLKRLLDIIKSISARVFVVFGNHDYISNDNVFNKIELPDNLYIFSSNFSFYQIDELNTRVYGVSYNNYNFKKDFIIPGLDKNFNNIGIFHTDLNDERYMKMDLNDFKEFDYVALGHIHKRNKISENTFYAGSIIPLSFKDEGSRGAVVYDTSNKSYQYLDFNEREFIKLSVDINEGMSFAEILNSIQLKLDSKNIYRIILNGNHSHFFEIEKFLYNNLEALNFEIENNLKPSLSIAEIINREEYLKEFFNSFGDSKREMESRKLIENYILEQVYDI